MIVGTKRQIAFLLICLCLVRVAGAFDYDPNDFAAEVVSYIQGEGVGYDWIDLEDYNEPDNALGRPTLETTGDMDIGPDIIMAVVPVYPAWRSFEVVTIGRDGELVLRFNHRVGDDENNLWGIDFILFGNARWRIKDGGSWTPESDPESVTVGSGFYAEQGIVSVSQDGQSWYTFSDGPYADDFAPTASYEWDDVNDVWAEELAPTRPVEADLTIGDFDGNSVAEVIDAYDGSAGGTGFDLAGLDPNDYADLTIDANTGRKWIRYVKIEDDPCGAGLPEIDAISDVSCCGDYKHLFPAGDLNKDCRVDFYDFAIVAADWADISDVAVVVDNWLECNWECE